MSAMQPARENNASNYNHPGGLMEFSRPHGNRVTQRHGKFQQVQKKKKKKKGPKPKQFTNEPGLHFAHDARGSPCPVPGCLTVSRRLRQHAYERHLPDVFDSTNNPRDHALAKRRMEALTALTKKLKGTNQNPAGLINFLNKSKEIPDKATITDNDVTAMTTLCHALKLKVPPSFTLVPINHVAVLIHWRPLLHLTAKLPKILQMWFKQLQLDGSAVKQRSVTQPRYRETQTREVQPARRRSLQQETIVHRSLLQEPTHHSLLQQEPVSQGLLPLTAGWNEQEPFQQDWIESRNSSKGWMDEQNSSIDWIEPKNPSTGWNEKQNSSIDWIGQQPSTEVWMERQQNSQHFFGKSPAISELAETITKQTSIEMNTGSNIQMDKRAKQIWQEASRNKFIRSRRKPQPELRVFTQGGVCLYKDPSSFPIRIPPNFRGWAVAVGIDPPYTPVITDREFEHLKSLSREPGVCLGDIGLDRSNPSNIWLEQDRQLKQLLTLNRASVPVILRLIPPEHDRYGLDVYSRGLVLMMEACPPNQPIHLLRFQGTEEVVKEWVHFFPNTYFGFSEGMANFDEEQIFAIKAVPSNRIILEMDSLDQNPFMAMMNMKEFIGKMARYMAAKLGVSPEEVLQLSADNAQQLYHLQSDQ